MSRAARVSAQASASDNKTVLLTDAWEGLEAFFAPGREVLTAAAPEDTLAALDRDDLAAAQRQRRNFSPGRRAIRGPLAQPEHLTGLGDGDGGAVLEVAEGQGGHRAPPVVASWRSRRMAA